MVIANRRASAMLAPVPTRTVDNRTPAAAMGIPIIASSRTSAAASSTTAISGRDRVPPATRTGTLNNNPIASGSLSVMPPIQSELGSMHKKIIATSPSSEFVR